MVISIVRFICGKLCRRKHVVNNLQINEVYPDINLMKRGDKFEVFAARIGDDKGVSQLMLGGSMLDDWDVIVALVDFPSDLNTDFLVIQNKVFRTNTTSIRNEIKIKY